MLIRPNKAETVVHGCHCPVDMAVRMRNVLARPWVGVRVCRLLLLLFSKHNLSWEVNSFLRALSLRKTVSSEDIGLLKFGNIISLFPSFSWGIICHVTRSDKSGASENIWGIIISVFCPWTLSVLRSEQFSENLALENCEFWGTDYVQGQISEHIFWVKWRLLYLLEHNDAKDRKRKCCLFLLPFKYFSPRSLRKFVA